MQFSSFIAALALASSAVTQTVTQCAGVISPFQLQTAEIAPFPVKIGGNVTVAATGFLAKGGEITEGAHYKVQLKVGRVTIFSEDKPFCVASAEAGFPCPITAGPQSFSVSQSTPLAAPEGKFTLVVNVYNHDESLISCLSGPVELIK